MAQVQIHDDDFLWKYYQKAHTLNKCSVPKPTNLCPYFWTAVVGMLASFLMEANLWLIWAVNTINLAACVYCAILIKSVAPNAPFWPALAITIYTMVTAISCICTFGVTGDRLTGIWKKLYIGSWIAILGSVFAGLIGFLGYTIGLAVTEANFSLPPWPSTPFPWEGFFQGIGVVALSLAGLAAVGFLFYLIWKVMLHPMRSWRLLQNIWAMLKAMKQRACPMLTAPADFLAALEEKERLAKEKAAQEKQEGEPVPVPVTTG